MYPCVRDKRRPSSVAVMPVAEVFVVRRGFGVLGCHTLWLKGIVVVGVGMAESVVCVT